MQDSRSEKARKREKKKKKKKKKKKNKIKTGVAYSVSPRPRVGERNKKKKQERKKERRKKKRKRRRGLSCFFFFPSFLFSFFFPCHFRSFGVPVVAAHLTVSFFRPFLIQATFLLLFLIPLTALSFRIPLFFSSSPSVNLFVATAQLSSREKRGCSRIIHSLSFGAR